MKKVFKGSLLAASVAMAFGAQAAEVSSTAVQLSEQGLNVDEFSTGVVNFDVVVSKEHPSASKITLTMSDSVDLTGLVGGSCTQVPAEGLGACGDVAFDYGTGSFTFDSVAVDDQENTISFNVNLGNPLTANSAFRVYVGAYDLSNSGTPASLDNSAGTNATIKGAATLDYYSETASEVFIEDGDSTLSTVVDQFSAAVSDELNAVIKRQAPRTEFVSAFDAGDDQADTLTLSFGDKASLTNSVGIDATGVTVTLEASDISDTATHVPAAWVAAGTTTAPAIVNTAGTIEFTYTKGEWDTIITNGGTETITFTKANSGETLDASSFDVSIEADYVGPVNSGQDTDSVLTDADAGQWILDAAVVNVPYLPVNYGLTPNVEIANEGNTDAEIIVEAIDNQGNELGPVTLDFMADAKTVTKVSEADLDEAFGLEGASRKMSVTFVIDANESDITLAPYYRENESRINVISDQYKK